MAVLIISFWWDLLIIFATLFGVFYAWMKYHYGYWKRKGIEGPAPSLFIGNMSGLFSLKRSIGEILNDLYNEYKMKPYIGIYTPFEPTWLVNDLDLIKKMLVKDFTHFTDHSIDINVEAEPLSAHLFTAKGDKWKNLRAKLSPAFTSSKMRLMFEIVEARSRSMLEYLENNDTDVVDLQDVLAKYTTDVIGSCAFGLECNSFNDPNSKFRQMGKRLSNPPWYKNLLVLMVFMFPNITSKIKFSVLGKEINDFFNGIVEETIEYREKNNVKRNDFLQMLIQLKNDGVVEDSEELEKPYDDGTRLTISQIAAQVFVFFLAGFETSSTTATYVLYEMALNPDLQEILLEEIDCVLADHGGKITYESLNEMSYLTRVVEETLRKYPPLPVILRRCTKDYPIPNTDIIIEKGLNVMIPIHGIQNDPRYFSDPKKFDPDRFTHENKETHHHFSYMPFGEGPRICIGSRFGLMQTKLGIVSILSKYGVEVCKETPIPLVFTKKNILILPEDGLRLKLKQRN